MSPAVVPDHNCKQAILYLQWTADSQNCILDLCKQSVSSSASQYIGLVAPSTFPTRCPSALITRTQFKYEMHTHTLAGSADRVEAIRSARPGSMWGLSDHCACDKALSQISESGLHSELQMLTISVWDYDSRGGSIPPLVAGFPMVGLPAHNHAHVSINRSA
jgi:hypothetical protein